MVAVDNGGERRAVEYRPRATDGPPTAAAPTSMAACSSRSSSPGWTDVPDPDGPRRPGIAGSSLGGLVSLYLGLHHPDVFGQIAALSTSAWLDDRLIARFVDALPGRPETRIWTDIGTHEGRSAVTDARALRDALVRQGWREGVDLRHVEAEGATHNEVAWATRLPAVLQFLFPPRI